MNKSKNMINLINYADQLIKVLDSLKKTKNNNINKISKKLIEVCKNNNRKILAVEMAEVQLMQITLLPN